MEHEPLLESAIDDGKDKIWFRPIQGTDGSEQPEQPDLIVYFIPGNPCMMSYYERFLSRLSVLLNSGSSEGSQSTSVGGCSLPGFELSYPPGVKRTVPAGLKDQILGAEELISRTVGEFGSTERDCGSAKRTMVILMAHSVGAYMTLEILQRRTRGLSDLAALDIIGAVLLFPTVTEIARSQHGTILSSLLYIPYFPATIAAIAHAVTYFISLSTLGRIISYVGRVPKHVGQATAEFLKSPMGVYQALYLTVDEMKMIKHDSWDDTIWGSSQPTPEDQARVVPLRFYFGEQDVWVSNKARDELIATRAKRYSDARATNKPEMVIDDENIPHGFIIDHSERVAEKARAMVDDIINVDKVKNSPP